MSKFDTICVIVMTIIAFIVFYISGNYQIKECENKGGHFIGLHCVSNEVIIKIGD